MSFKVLRGQIKTLLDSISTIHDVSGTPKLKFSGYPSAYVVPSDNEADYETTTENIRTYAFMVLVFHETKKTGVGDALDKLGGIIDTVLDTFDQEDLKGAASRTVGISLPSGYTFLNILAHPAQWGEVEGETLVYAEISVKIRVSRDIT